MESGEVEVTEWTNYCLSARLKAATMGVSFVPIRNIMGTDTFKYSGAKKIKCPFTDQYYVLMPALYPDVSVIHVHEADVYGNSRIRGITISDLDLARASKHLIITTERIVSTEHSEMNLPIHRFPSTSRMQFAKFPSEVIPATCPMSTFQMRNISENGWRRKRTSRPLRSFWRRISTVVKPTLITFERMEALRECGNSGQRNSWLITMQSNKCLMREGGNND